MLRRLNSLVALKMIDFSFGCVIFFLLILANNYLNGIFILSLNHNFSDDPCKRHYLFSYTLSVFFLSTSLVSIRFFFSLSVALRASCCVTQHSLRSSSFILSALIYRPPFFLYLKRGSVRVTVNLSCFDGVLFEKETEIVPWVGVMDVVHALWVQAKSLKLMIDSLLKSCFWLFMCFLSNRGQRLVGLHGRWKITL